MLSRMSGSRRGFSGWPRKSRRPSRYSRVSIWKKYSYRRQDTASASDDVDAEFGLRMKRALDPRVGDSRRRPSSGTSHMTLMSKVEKSWALGSSPTSLHWRPCDLLGDPTVCFDTCRRSSRSSWMCFDRVISSIYNCYGSRMQSNCNTQVNMLRETRLQLHYSIIHMYSV